MHKALVVGTLPRVLLSVVRSLGRAGIQVHSAWHPPDCPALRSRYLFQAHELPSYDNAGTAWKDALCRLLRRERFDLVIPCNDWETIVFHQHRHDLERLARIYLPDPRSFTILFDKIRTGEWARSVGVATPREMVVRRPEEATAVLERLRLPLVVKPPQSFYLELPGEHQQVRTARTADELRSLLPPLLGQGPVLVQERFEGRGVGVELLLDHGEPLLAFQHLRVHEPLYGGPSSYRESVPLSAPLLDAAVKLLGPLRYTGVAMVEFKQDERTGAWVFLEVNARFWGSLPLAMAAGVDFPLALFRLLVEGGRPEQRPYRTGIYCRNLELDLQWQRANLAARRTQPALATRSPLGVVGEAVAHWLAGSERNDTWADDDPAPGLAELTDLARRAWARMLRPLGLSGRAALLS